MQKHKKKTSQQKLLDAAEAYLKWNYMYERTSTGEERRDALYRELRKRNRMRRNGRW